MISKVTAPHSHPTNANQQKAQIQVLDTTTAAFGYITVDCVCQSPDSKGAVRVIAGPPSIAKTAV